MSSDESSYGRLGGNDNLAQTLGLLDAQWRLLQKAAGQKLSPDSVHTVTQVLAIAAADSCVSFIHLVGLRQYRDAYVTTRTIADTLINLVYVVSLGEPAADSATSADG